MRAVRKTQVLIIGGGPAGSTAASFLARSGYDIVVAERAQFPRYHIGESLLPSCLEILDLIGARDLIERSGFQFKNGAVLDWKGERWELSFGELMGRHTYAYQVEREKFDTLLLEHASTSGATVMEGLTVQSLEFEGERPVAALLSGPDGPQRIEFDYLIDASGRRGVMATQYLENRSYPEEFKNIAVWGYWKDTARLPDGRDGAIAVGSIPGGWIWGIPLSGDTMSVGVVLHRDVYACEMADGRTLKEIYVDALAKSDFIGGLLADGRMVSDLKVEQDYSYSSDRFSGPGYLMIGDAACFLDPLLSTGVHLAMYSAMLGAASLTSVLNGTFGEREAFDYFEKSYRNAYTRFFIFVESFYRMKGRDSYFAKAADLSSYQADKDRMQTSFLNLVSGLEDVALAEHSKEHLIGEMKRRISENLDMRSDKTRLTDLVKTGAAAENAKFFDTIEGLTCLSPDHAISGVYVETSPQVHLARVVASDVQAHGSIDDQLSANTRPPASARGHGPLRGPGQVRVDIPGTPRI
jgi:flavin-dependent dehydrogenase